jgi:hypothetical protein
MRDPLVRIPIVLGAALLAAVSLDAMLRIWRAAWVWMPVDRGRGVFRLVWVVALALGLVVTAAAAWSALTA